MYLNMYNTPGDMYLLFVHNVKFCEDKSFGKNAPKPLQDKHFW